MRTRLLGRLNRYHPVRFSDIEGSDQDIKAIADSREKLGKDIQGLEELAAVTILNGEEYKLTARATSKGLVFYYKSEWDAISVAEIEGLVQVQAEESTTPGDDLSGLSEKNRAPQAPHIRTEPQAVTLAEALVGTSAPQAPQTRTEFQPLTLTEALGGTSNQLTKVLALSDMGPETPEDQRRLRQFATEIRTQQQSIWDGLSPDDKVGAIEKWKNYRINPANAVTASAVEEANQTTAKSDSVSPVDLTLKQSRSTKDSCTHQGKVTTDKKNTPLDQPRTDRENRRMEQRIEKMWASQDEQDEGSGQSRTDRARTLIREVRQRQEELYELSLGVVTDTSAHLHGPKSPAQSGARDKMGPKVGLGRLLPRTQTTANPPTRLKRQNSQYHTTGCQLGATCMPTVRTVRPRKPQQPKLCPICTRCHFEPFYRCAVLKHIRAGRALLPTDICNRCLRYRTENCGTWCHKLTLYDGRTLDTLCNCRSKHFKLCPKCPDTDRTPVRSETYRTKGRQ